MRFPGSAANVAPAPLPDVVDAADAAMIQMCLYELIRDPDGGRRDA
jgi:hypothetical protein